MEDEKIDILKQHIRDWRTYRNKYKLRREPDNEHLEYGLKTIFIYNDFEENNSCELFSFITQRMNIEQMRRSKYFIYQLMNWLNAYSKYAEYKNDTNQPKLKTLSRAKEKSSITVIHNPDQSQMQTMLKRVSDLIEEVQLYYHDGASHDWFDSQKLNEELQKYKNFIEMHSSKKTFAKDKYRRGKSNAPEEVAKDVISGYFKNVDRDIAKSKYNDFEYNMMDIIDKKFVKYKIKDYRKPLDDFIKSLTEKFLRSINDNLIFADKMIMIRGEAHKKKILKHLLELDNRIGIDLLNEDMKNVNSDKVQLKKYYEQLEDDGLIVIKSLKNNTTYIEITEIQKEKIKQFLEL